MWCNPPQHHRNWNWHELGWTCLPMRISYAFLVLLRKDILELHERFECGGGWGLERTLQTWVSKQPWRWPMPTTFFEHLASICSQSSLCLFIFDTLEKMLFDVIHRSESLTPVSGSKVRGQSAINGMARFWIWPVCLYSAFCFTMFLPLSTDNIRIGLLSNICFPAKVQRTDQQVLLGNRPFTKQCVMLPHDIVAHLFKYHELFHPIFTGEPGRIQQYWEQNMDLFESLGMPDLEARLFSVLSFSPFDFRAWSKNDTTPILFWIQKNTPLAHKKIFQESLYD